MISYEPLWKTMEEKNITRYDLIYNYGLSSNTLRRIKKNEHMSTMTANHLCLILDCKISDIIEFIPSEEELINIQKEREVIENRKRKKQKK